MDTAQTVPFSVAILVGGQSRRMGRNKILLALGDRSVLQHMIDRLQPLTDDLFLVARDPEPYLRFGLPVHRDESPLRGSLVGINRALHSARYPWTFVTAGDMPLVNPAIVRAMAARRIDVDVVVPQVTPHPEPLHAFYHQRCLLPIQQYLQAEQLKIIRFYNEVRVCHLPKAFFQAIDPTLDFLVNLNTPSDFERLQQFYL